MGIHMDINTHTPLKEHTGTQAQRGQTQPHAETQILKGRHTLNYAGAVTLRATDNQE